MQKKHLLCNRGSWLIAICLFSLFIFPSCSKKHPDTKLIVVKDGLICTIYNGKPFTGKVTDVINKQKIEYDVVKGIKDGHFNVFSENGNKIISGEMRNNKNDGLWQYFYPDGQLESKGYFNNDMADERWIWYFPDGKLKSVGRYYNGVKDGKWINYDKSGRIVSEKMYRGDKIIAELKDMST